MSKTQCHYFQIVLLSLVTFLVFISLLLVQVGNAHAQTYYLKGYVLGNSNDPGNRNFSWKASKYCPYNWSIKTNRVNTFGGEIELHASPGTKPECKSIYRITWAFSKDMRTVSCGEKIFVDITNVPISKQDCGIFVWEGDQNPSSITILDGMTPMVRERIRKDPPNAYWGYVIQHYPGQVVQGEPSAYQAVTPSHHLHSARLELVVCSRADMAKMANGGSFAFRIGNRGINFDVVYLYSKNTVLISSTGRVWRESESGWSGVWTRRGNSNVYDAVWTSGRGQVTAVMTISISGNNVRITRQNNGDNGTCDYVGTIGADGRSVSGTYSCSWQRGPMPWNAVIID